MINNLIPETILRKMTFYPLALFLIFFGSLMPTQDFILSGVGVGLFTFAFAVFGSKLNILGLRVSLDGNPSRFVS